MQNLLTLAANPFNIEDAYVIVLGVGTVFVGLVCIIILCKILSVCCKLLAKNQSDEAKSPANSAPAAAPAPSLPFPFQNKPHNNLPKKTPSLPQHTRQEGFVFMWNGCHGVRN